MQGLSLDRLIVEALYAECMFRVYSRDSIEYNIHPRVVRLTQSNPGVSTWSATIYSSCVLIGIYSSVYFK